MNSINWTQVRHDVTETIKHEALECTKRVVAAVAIAALLGAFSLHIECLALGLLPVSVVLSGVALISSKIACIAAIQYAVEKIASKILNKVFIDDNTIAKIIKFVAPLLLSISTSFAFLYAVDGLYGLEFLNSELDSMQEALFYIPTFSDGLAFYETWGLKVFTEGSISLINASIKGIKSFGNAISNVYQRVSASFQNQAA